MSGFWAIPRLEASGASYLLSGQLQLRVKRVRTMLLPLKALFSLQFSRCHLGVCVIKVAICCVWALLFWSVGRYCEPIAFLLFNWCCHVLWLSQMTEVSIAMCLLHTCLKHHFLFVVLRVRFYCKCLISVFVNVCTYQWQQVVYSLFWGL